MQFIDRTIVHFLIVSAAYLDMPLSAAHVRTGIGGGYGMKK
jgi:hypothetical protein